MSLGALEDWKIWSLEVKSALRQADGFGREVYVRAPCEWNSRAVAVFGNWRPLRTALMMPRRHLIGPMRNYLVNSMRSPSAVGLRFEVSSFDPRLYFVFRTSGGAVGAIGTHIDDILSCGEADLSHRAGAFWEHDLGKCRFTGSPLRAWAWNWRAGAISL